MMTAKASTKGQIVLPQKLRDKHGIRPGDTFEFVEGDDPDVIVMRKISRRPNAGLVDALLTCPHRFEVPVSKSEIPKRIKL
jgi:AbrB family looped-hinge helix DNA binding protein